MREAARRTARAEAHGASRGARREAHGARRTAREAHGARRTRREAHGARRTRREAHGARRTARHGAGLRATHSESRTWHVTRPAEANLGAETAERGEAPLEECVRRPIHGCEQRVVLFMPCSVAWAAARPAARGAWRPSSW